ncbi:SSU rRNA (adenine(1518)-N(6)/adenine(1519)-N(6))- dimethyltransferase [Desulfurella amilsii]|uniref:Ribosomal RNA small subunit methyltransferase A n=1 Tax=Desulfurella amilsii TaxID=1562698 RepID=A0A1X4XZK9_9BACT|nr:16S rRNA (adenine(1518)-N(6)/adenine(1519)-N(6))-dimethyltransferase RsmA [Desulfurella amilsii]OSS42958.1 SSU rRNA (adenine(1518)-N(6)/adenine(1519)-N(6))- dimethyltransferase [Desulfurella amilsii]
MQAKKSLGQHFLHDKSVIWRIVSLIDEPCLVLEIGPGGGALTEGLLEKSFSVDAVEFDKDMVEYLKEKFKDSGRLNIIEADATTYRLDKSYCVMGNLPYNVSKKIIVNMINQKNFVKKMILMVQKEVADTIIAQPKTKEYSKFSIFVQIFCKVRRVFDVQASAFKPPPKVISSVVELVPYEVSLFNEPPESDFFDFLKKFFAQPNKTIRNNLKGYITVQYLNENLILNTRPRQVGIQEIYKFYKYLKERKWV